MGTLYTKIEHYMLTFLALAKQGKFNQKPSNENGFSPCSIRILFLKIISIEMYFPKYLILVHLLKCLGYNLVNSLTQPTNYTYLDFLGCC